MRSTRTRQALLALRRPDLLVRKLRGLPVIEIGLDEIAAAMHRAPRSILEAGAADGRDTVLIAQRWPTAAVHAFEPVPGSYAKLVTCTRDLANVHCHPTALAPTSGRQTMWVSSHASGGETGADSSSLLAPTGHLEAMPEVLFESRVEVDTLELDQWALREGITSIDLMWLDMQGVELATLQASTVILPTVQAVVMEVCRQELYAGGPLYGEVLSWMSGQGFDLAIDRVSYMFGNALFVRRGA